MVSNKELKWLIRDKYAGDPRASGISKDMERLRAGEPLAYVIGWTPFLNARIDLRYRLLIPRAETEFWTEQMIRAIGRKKADVLDIFCGSGCIGVAILKSCPNTHLTFADLDPRALRQTRLNLKLNEIEKDRYEIVRSDVWRGIRGKFHLVLANPPYVPATRRKKLKKSVVAYEPHAALFSGADGLSAIRKLMRDLHSHLNKNGRAVLEFDSGQSRKLAKLARTQSLRCRIEKDQYGRIRTAELMPE